MATAGPKPPRRPRHHHLLFDEGQDVLHDVIDTLSLDLAGSLVGAIGEDNL